MHVDLRVSYSLPGNVWAADLLIALQLTALEMVAAHQTVNARFIQGPETLLSLSNRALLSGLHMSRTPWWCALMSLSERQLLL